MSDKNGAVSTVAEILSKSERVLTTFPRGFRLRVRFPTADALMQSGHPTVVASLETPEQQAAGAKSRRRKAQKPEEIDPEDAKAAMLKLMELVMIEPRFHAGKGKPPPGMVTEAMLGDDLIDAYVQVANWYAETAEEGAKQAARFRVVGGGEAGEPGGATLPGAPHGDPAASL